MAAAQEGDTIQLSADITISSSDLGSQSLGLYASKGHKSQTLDLNGHKLSIETGNSDACFIVSGLTFTVVNSVPNQGGLAGKSHGSFVKGYKDANYKNANLILRDIEIAFENNSGSASTAPVVAGFENRLTLDNVTYHLKSASKPYVANIAGRNYTDLAAAVDAASDGQTVRLVASFEEAVTIPAGKNITLDLNGNTLTNEAGYHTITNNGTLTITDPAGGGVVDNISHACSAVCNNVGGTVVFSGGTFTRSREAGINTEDNGGNSFYVLQNFGEMKVESGVTVSMTSGYSSLFENGWYDGRQNDTQAEAVLTIEGGTFSGGLNTIKNDDWGVLTINDGKFTNMQQYAVFNWNKMKINGGTFEVTDDSDAVVCVGFAHDSMDQGKLTITGGTFNGGLYAVYANTGTDIEISNGTFNSSVYALSGAKIAITGGTFNHSVYSASCENFISGGTFTMEFPAAEYVAENCSLTQYGVVTDIAPAAEIEKDGKVYAFATIADALALASRGDTITLVGNVTENVVIAKNKVVTLDLNGYTLTNATGEQGDHTILNNGTLTIIDGSYAGTGRVITTGGQNCAAVYNAIGGEVTLDGGTYTSNRTTGDYYIIQNHSAMTINDGVTVLQPSVVSSGIASGWYTPAEESQTTYLTINGGTFASNRITVKNDEINVLVINGGTFDQTEGYGDAGYAVQSVQNWAIGILGGGTFGANVQSWAYQSGAGIVRGSLDITGGAYLGTVSAHYYINSNESREDDTPDVEISGGAFASQPAEKFLTAGFTTVSNSEGMFTVVGENSAEADALRTAQVNAQADVGQYLATLGLKDFDLASDDPYTGIQDDEVSLADETAAVNAALTALRTAYAYIAAARSEYDVAGARLAAMEAADALADALAAELSAYKAAVTASIEEAKEEGMADLETWLNAYLDELLGTAGETTGVIRAAAYTAETTDGDIYAKLAQAFSEENAKLVLKYYNDALAAIDAAESVSDVTTAVSAFKAQVASVEAAAGNTPSLTAVYILLAVVLVVAIAVFAAVLLRRAPAPQPAAPAEGTPAAPAQETAVTEAAPEEEVSVSEGTPEDEASEEAPAEESAAEERAVNTIVLPELDGDREHIVIAANVRSFDEAYEALGDEARSLFNKVKAYALSKPDTEEIPLSSGVCIKRGSKKVVKLAVRRGNPVALFLLESDGLKDLRRSASASVRLKVRETELVLREESDLEAAYTMVDLSIGQIERDIEEAKERRREARRLRRRQLRETAASEAAVSEETEDIPEEGAADETPADESDV